MPGPLGNFLENTITGWLGGGPPKDMSLQGGYTPATNGYNPSTTQQIDPGVGNVPAQPASWTPQSFADPQALKWVLRNNPQLFSQLMAGNQAMAQQQMMGQQQFGLQNNVNPANGGDIRQADQLTAGLLPSTIASRQAGNQASGTGSMVEMLKNLGIMPQAYSLGQTTAQAGIGQNNMLSQQFLNALQQAKGAAPFQPQMGASGAQTQLGTEAAQRATAEEEATKAQQTGQYLQDNRSYIPEQMKTQATFAQNQANSLARTPMYAGGTTAIYGQNNMPTGFISEQYPQTTINGQPFPLSKMNPQPSYQPSGIFRGKEDFLGSGGRGNAISTPLTGQPQTTADTLQRQVPTNVGGQQQALPAALLQAIGNPHNPLPQGMGAQQKPPIDIQAIMNAMYQMQQQQKGRR